MATIFQEVLVADDLTVLDNLFAGADSLWRRGHSPADSRALGAEMLQRLAGATIDLDTEVNALPLSVKQWIVIARSLLCKPKLLILDESSAALDLDATSRLHAELRMLKAEGCCVVIVTHRIAELIKITDRATVLRDGAVVGALAGSEITERNLLSLMSPNRQIVSEAKGTVPAPKKESAATVMSATGITIRRGGHPFNFDLHRGEIVGVTGLDGQGHTNFVRVMAGILPPFDGQIELRGEGSSHPLARLADATGGGVVFVSGDRAKEGIFPNLSILENFSLAMYPTTSGSLGWINRPQLIKMFRAEVKRLKIRTGPWSNRITSLSGGNQQKVLIGRAFAQTPKVIVLDDPARGVDAGTKRELYTELKSFAAAGGSAIYLSSEIEEFFGFADRVLVFREGSVFDTIPATDISEHSILAAMFGQSRDATLSYDATVSQ